MSLISYEVTGRGIENRVGEVDGIIDSHAEELARPFGPLLFVMKENKWPRGAVRAIEGIQEASDLYSGLTAGLQLPERVDTLEPDTNPQRPTYLEGQVRARRSSAMAASIIDQILAPPKPVNK